MSCGERLTQTRDVEITKSNAFPLHHAHVHVDNNLVICNDIAVIVYVTRLACIHSNQKIIMTLNQKRDTYL